jgi:hypothetical protein
LNTPIEAGSRGGARMELLAGWRSTARPVAGAPRVRPDPAWRVCAPTAHVDVDHNDTGIEIVAAGRGS